MDQIRTLDVQALIDASPLGRLQWRVFGFCLLIILLDGFDTAAIGYVAPSLMSQWGVTRADLAPVLSAALLGLAFGALVAGPLADRRGRKSVLVGAVALMGIASVLSAFSGSLGQLAAWRCVAGLGLGAAMPNAVTLTSEFCPTGRRATLTNVIFCGFPIGAACGGFLAGWIIPLDGWRSVLLLGGLVPLVLCGPLLLWLPESLRFQVAAGHAPARIAAVLGRIATGLRPNDRFVLGETDSSGTTGPKGGLRLMLAPASRIGTVMLWVTYFMGLVIFFAMVNWLPVLLNDAGLSAPSAAFVAALFPLGGVGAIAAGWLMDRFNADMIVAAAYGLTAVFVAAIGQAVGHPGALIAAVLLGGLAMNVAQSSMPSLAAAFYPTASRSTGIAWMMGLGRFGGIAGSYLVAELARRHLPFGVIFAVVGLAGAVAAAALVIKLIVHPQPRRLGAPAAAASMDKP